MKPGRKSPKQGRTDPPGRAGLAAVVAAGAPSAQRVHDLSRCWKSMDVSRQNLATPQPAQDSGYRWCCSGSAQHPSVPSSSGPNPVPSGIAQGPDDGDCFGRQPARSADFQRPQTLGKAAAAQEEEWSSPEAPAAGLPIREAKSGAAKVACPESPAVLPNWRAASPRHSSSGPEGVTLQETLDQDEASSDGDRDLSVQSHLSSTRVQEDAGDEDELSTWIEAKSRSTHASHVGANWHFSHYKTQSDKSELLSELSAKNVASVMGRMNHLWTSTKEFSMWGYIHASRRRCHSFFMSDSFELCQALFVNTAVVSFSFTPLALTVLQFEGEPFLDTCPHHRGPNTSTTGSSTGDHFTIVFILSPILLQGPCCLWLREAATTKYLNQVALYLFFLWLGSCFRSLWYLYECHGVESTRNAVRNLYALTNVVAIFMCMKLAIERLVVLEAHMLQDLHTRLMKRGTLSVTCICFVAYWFSTSSYIMNCVYIALLVFAVPPWCIFLLHGFWSTRRLVGQAARFTTGCRQAEAKQLRKTATVQMVGLANTVLTTWLELMLASLWTVYFEHDDLERIGISKFDADPWYRMSSLLDMLANCLGAIALSGALTGAIAGGRECRSEEATRLKTLRKSRRAFKPCENKEWSDKVKELAQRGITLSALLRFYKHDLPQQMPDFDPKKHKTNDVVRRVIIPLSCQMKSAYATVLMGGHPLFPNKMITHGWGNLFRDLVAAIVADALHEDEYEEIANLLDRDVSMIEAWVRKLGVGERAYWICAFAVNQHAGICSVNPKNDCDPISGDVQVTCDCDCPKFLNDTPPLYAGKSTRCEMNKFDHMMAYLAARDRNFEQVIAVDAAFDLFTRAWCLSELAKAFVMGMKQNLKLLSVSCLLSHQESLTGIKIENTQASRPEDVADILAEIPDKAAFNAKLESMISQRLIPRWNKLDALEQTVSIARVARWQTLVVERKTVGIYSQRPVEATSSDKKAVFSSVRSWSAELKDRDNDEMANG